MPHPWAFTDYTAVSGLGGSFVFGLAFDANGTLWVASSTGLRSFDGVTWTLYTEEDGLPSSFVRAVHCDREGRLWIGTDQGLAVGDASGFQTVDFQPDGLNIRRIREDIHGALWISSDSWLQPERAGGLTRIVGDSAEAVPVPSTYVSDTVHLPGGQTLLLTSEAVYRLDGDSWTLLGGGLPIGYPRDLLRLPSGDLLLSTSDSVYRLDRNRWVDVSTGIGQKGFLSFLRRGDAPLVHDRLDGRVKRFDGSTWTPETFLADGITILEQVVEAPDGGLWLAGMGLLGRFGPSRSWVRHEALDGLPHEDGLGRLWFRSSEGSLVREDDRWKPVAGPGLRIATRGTDATWLWSQRRVLRYDASGALTAFSLADLGLDRVSYFSANRDGEAIAVEALPDHAPRLVVFDGQAWQRRDLHGQVHEVSDLVLDDSGTIWIAGAQRPTLPVRILMVDADTARVTIAPAVTELAGARFWIDHNSIMLVGDFGLAQFVDGEWDRFDGLPSRAILGWFENDHGTWVAHSAKFGGTSGVTHVSPGHSASRYHLEPIRSLQANIIYTDDVDIIVIDTTASGVAFRIRSPSSRPDAALRASNGDYWVSGPEGVFHLPFSDAAPETEAVLASESVITEQRLQVFVDSQVPWGAGRGRPHQFAWRLDEGPWSMFTNTEQLQIPTAGVSTGRHTLEVRSRSVFGIEDPTPAVLTFTVIPVPLQQRPWFWPALVVILVSTFTASVAAFRSRGLLAQLNAELEERVQARTAALLETRTRLEAIIRVSPATIAVLDDQLRIELCNPAAAAMAGLPPDEVVGHSVRRFLDHEASEAVAKIVAAAMSGTPQTDRLVSAWLGDGRLVHVAHSAARLTSAADRPRVLLVGIDITDRVRAQHQLRDLGLELQRVQEMERRRLAQDLHDEVGGGLTTLKLSLLMELHQNGGVDPDGNQAERIELVQTLMNRIRSVSLLLRPSTLDDFGLAAAVRTIVKQVNSVSTTEIHLADHLDAEMVLTPDIETAAYRIVQECLTNISRHAHATEAHIVLWAQDNALRLRVSDDGGGFNLLEPNGSASSSGLSGMRQRAEVLGGTFSITSSPSGTIVEVSFPLGASTEANPRLSAQTASLD